MNPNLLKLTLSILEKHRLMTLATSRPDGWPQATTVGYCSESLALYFFVSRTGQKYANLMRDRRVSVAISGGFDDALKITGLSLGGFASRVENRDEYDRIVALFSPRFPEFASYMPPNPVLAPLFKFVPKIMSVIDYRQGFGHTDLVEIAAPDFDAVRTATAPI